MAKNGDYGNDGAAVDCCEDGNDRYQRWAVVNTVMIGTSGGLL